MEEIKLPTTTELMKRIGVERHSISCGDSRVILKYLDNPVIAYGIGFNGFVCIIKTCQNFLKGYSYSLAHMFTTYPLGGFSDVGTEKVIEVINNNKLIVEKAFDKEAFDGGKLRPDYANERPVLGTINYENRSKYNICGSWKTWDNEKMRIVQLKDGKLRAEIYYKWSNGFKLCSLSSFIKSVEREEGITKSKNSDGSYDGDETEFKMVENTVSKELLQQAKDQLLIKEI